MLVTAFALHSCSMQENAPDFPSEWTITAAFDNDSPSTRTCAGEGADGKLYGIMWNPEDRIGVFSADGAENAIFSTKLTMPYGEATFSGELSSAPAYAYYPYSAGNDGTRTLTGTLPANQAFSTADGLLRYDFKTGTPNEGRTDRFTFRSIFPMLRFVVDATGTAVAGEAIESIVLDLPVEVPYGDFTLPVGGGTPSFTSPAGGNQSLTLTYEDKPMLSAGKVVYGYLSCPQLAGLSGKSVKVTLLTSSYAVSFSADLKIDAFEAGSFYTFPLTLSAWKDKLGDGFSVVERPAITSLQFTATLNEGKILGKKLTYSNSRNGSTSYVTDAASTTCSMSVSNGKISGTIPYLFDRNLYPSIGYTVGATLSFSSDEGTAFTEWDGQSPIDFSSGNIIRIEKDGAYRDYTIDIVNTGLPIVVINQPDGDSNWSETGTAYWSKDTDFDLITGGTITIYNPDGTVSLATSEAASRIRGNSTQLMPKKPFAIKLAAKASVLGMPKHKRWVLLANWKDRSLLRNDICLGVARKFAETPFPDGSDNGNNWQVDGKFVELIYNGVHVGNYFLCEQIKIDKNRLNISGEYDSALYPSVTETDASLFGYLMEVDDNYDEADKFVTRFGLPVMFKDPLDGGGVLMGYMKERILDIEQNLYSGYKGAATSFDAAYNEMNINSFVDQLLIYEFTMNTEFVNPKSLYLYQDGTGTLHAGPVWDFDWQSFPATKSIGGCIEDFQTWDRDYLKSVLSTPGFQGNSFWRKNVPSSFSTSEEYAPGWFPMLIASDYFQQLCADRWTQMKPILSEYAEQIKAQGNLLEKSWEVNNSFWPAYDSSLGSRPGTAFDEGYCGDEKVASYQGVYELMYKSYNTRLAGMDFVISKTWPSFSISEK